MCGLCFLSPECLCRYITRPAVSEKRLSLTEHGNVRYFLETCQACGSAMKVTACIEDPDVIRKILDHRTGIPRRLRPAHYPNPGHHL